MVLSITSITLWEGSHTNLLHFKRSDEVWCYVPADEPTIHALIMMLYASGKTVNVHCYAEEEVIVGGMSAHKLHRIITL